jgi:predicted transcriptional regulator of viral defense system
LEVFTLLYSLIITNFVIIMEYRKVSREDLRRLARDRVVTTEELAKLFQRPVSSAPKLAFDLQKRGLLTKVRRGVYASVPLEADPRSFRPDPFLSSSSALGEGYVFSHQSALVLHGAEQTVRKTVHMTAPLARPRMRKVGELSVHVHGSPLEGWRSASTRVRRGGASLRVTTPERTLVDLAALSNSVQDYEEDILAFRSLLARVDARRLRREVMRRRRASTRARVGHLLQASGVEASWLRELQRAIEESLSGSSPSYFATRPRASSNRYDSRFNLVYPGGP